MLVCAVVACGDDTAPSVLVDVDTTALSRAPDSLYLTLTAPDGDALAHVSPVAANGVTRIQLIAGAHTPERGALSILAYAGRDVVGAGALADVELVVDSTAVVTLVLE